MVLKGGNMAIGTAQYQPAGLLVPIPAQTRLRLCQVYKRNVYHFSPFLPALGFRFLSVLNMIGKHGSRQTTQ